MYVQKDSRSHSKLRRQISRIKCTNITRDLADLLSFSNELVGDPSCAPLDLSKPLSFHAFQRRKVLANSSFHLGIDLASLGELKFVLDTDP